MPASLILESSSVVVDPGGTTVLRMRVQNTGSIVDEFELDVLGPARAWVSIQPPTISLFPGTEASVEIVFRPPRAPVPAAGMIPFGVRLRSRTGDGFSTVTEGRIDLRPFTTFEATLTPRTSRARREARHRVEVVNQGNVPLTVMVTARDPDERLEFVVQPAQLTVEPGAAASTRVQVRTKGGPLVGATETISFEVRVVPGTGAPQVLGGALQQRATLGSPTAIIGTVAIVAAAGVGLVTLSQPGAPLFPVFGGLFGPGPTEVPTPSAVASASLSPSPTPAPTPAPSAPPTDSPTVPPTPAPTEGPTLPPTPAPTPLPDLVTYAVDQNGNSEIWVIQPDGANGRQLTVNPKADLDPAISPDRRRVAFVSDRFSGSLDIWLINTDGSKERVLNKSGTDEMSPAWSPKGDRLAFVRLDNEGYRIVVARVDGRYSEVIVGPGQDPSWSPDGTQLYFVRQTDASQGGSGTTDVFRSAPTRNARAQLVYAGPGDEHRPMVSPLSPLLIYETSQGSVVVIESIDLTTLVNPRTLTNTAWRSEHQSLSPDARQIVFQSDRGAGGTQLWVMSIDGEPVFLAPLPNAPVRAFQPGWGARGPTP